VTQWMTQWVTHSMAKAERLDEETGPEGDTPPVEGGPTSGPLERSDGATGISTDPSLRGAAASRGFRTVLRNRYFLRLWIAQLISQTIQNAANYGLIIIVANRSHTSYFATSLAIVAFALPAALFGAPSGVLVDRLNRRAVLWVSNVVRASACLVFAFSLLVDQHALIPAYLLSFFIAMVGQFFAPAEGATIPLLVHREELINALSLFNITFTLAQALGLIILGPLIILFVPQITLGTSPYTLQIPSIVSLFIVVALLYCLCAVLILSIPIRRLRQRKPAGAPPRLRNETQQLRSMGASILESITFIRRDPRLLIAVAQLCLGGTVVAVIAMIAPGFVKTFFHQPAELAAMVFVPAGAGLVIGSAITPRIVRRWRYGKTIMVGVILLSVCAVLLSVSRGVAIFFMPDMWWTAAPYLAAAILLTFLVGIALDFINVPAQTIMQERSPDWIKGRVLAVQGMILNIATVIFVPLMGLVADHVSISTAMIILATAIAVVGLGTVYFSSRLDMARNSTVGAPLPKRI